MLLLHLTTAAVDTKLCNQTTKKYSQVEHEVVEVLLLNAVVEAH